MNVYHSLKEASLNPDIRNLALGFFDGLHLGHREVIAGNGVRTMLSFKEHPQTVLFRDRPVTLITGLPHKQDILENWKVPNIILLPFNKDVSLKSPDLFLSELHLAFPFLESIRVGENFRFGHQRAGNPHLLGEWGVTKKIRIEVIPSLLDQGSCVSSSRIRQLLAERELDAAATLLGRPYSLYGRVVEGQKVGRKLGFPTLNLATEDGQLLPLGVYHGRVQLSHTFYKAAINIGKRPTLGSGCDIWVEAHLLGFSGDLYGQRINLEISGFIREEIQFSSLDQLQKQIEQDVLAIKALPLC